VSIWDVFYFESGKIRLAGFGAQTGEFRHIDTNSVIALRVWIIKDINVFTGLGSHGGKIQEAGRYWQGLGYGF